LLLVETTSQMIPISRFISVKLDAKTKNRKNIARSGSVESNSRARLPMPSRKTPNSSRVQTACQQLEKYSSSRSGSLSTFTWVLQRIAKTNRRLPSKSNAEKAARTADQQMMAVQETGCSVRKRTVYLTWILSLPWTQFERTVERTERWFSAA